MQAVCKNEVKVRGRIVSPISYHHTFKTMEYYSFYIAIKRLSEVYDVIEVISPKYYVMELKEGDNVFVKGQYRSMKEGSRLQLFINAVNITKKAEENYENEILIEGMICQKRNPRITPVTNKVLMDAMVTVERGSGRTYCIPIIIWNAIGEEAEKFEVGRRIRLKGRIQSRTYLKKYPDGNQEEKTAYEVSVKEYEFME